MLIVMQVILNYDGATSLVKSVDADELCPKNESRTVHNPTFVLWRSQRQSTIRTTVDWNTSLIVSKTE